MYGTIARMTVQDGKLDELRQTMRVYDEMDVVGMKWSHVYQSDSDPNEVWVAVAFESREAYQANAGSPEQNARFQKMRALLTSDPEWHDGTIVQSVS